jgi:hypothetical protein
MRLPFLRIKFIDDAYGGGQNGLIRRALECNFSVVESDDPQLVFYGEGKERSFRLFRDAIRIYVAVENRYPNFKECDYALTCLFINNSRHLRLPMYVFDSDVDSLLQKHNAAEYIVSQSRDFCAFVVSNGSRRADRRLQFFEKLNNIRTVNSGGRLRNNVGGSVTDKQLFLKRHRFNLCFENHFWPGYTSEKLAHALAAGCIPIYWGNPAVAADFNPESFIDVSSFDSDEDAIEYILKVNDSQELQLKYLTSPCFYNKSQGYFYDENRLARFLKRSVDSPRPRRSFFPIASAVFRIRRQFSLI